MSIVTKIRESEPVGPEAGKTDVLGNRAGVPRQPARRDIARLLVRAALVLGLCWLLFAGVYYSLPYIRPGSEVVSKAKQQVIASGPLFDKRAAVRIAFFGNSKVLAGFEPRLFDALAGAGVNSYNLGIPNDLVHVRNLEVMCQRGEVPTLVLLIYPWAPPPAKPVDVFRPNIDDSDWMGALFPFRDLPRNAVVFALRARSRGGLRAYYRAGREQVGRMVDGRGYYFIEGQSHFANDCLPDDFHMQTDTPGTPSLRKPVIAAPEFDRLRRLADKYDLRVLFVPPYYRQSEFAPPADENAHLRQELAPYPRFGVAGPDYYLLPNKYFSDPAHLNREGADWYTRQLWQLLEPALRARTTPQSAAAGGTPTEGPSPRGD